MSLRTAPLTAGDQELIEAARQIIVANYERDRHHIGAAVRMSDGRVFVGVHVEAHVGRISLCAEAVALGAALSAGARDAQTVVAVAHRNPGDSDNETTVVAPCGMCRELIGDFGPRARVILPSDHGHPVTARIRDLLPAKYARE